MDGDPGALRCEPLIHDPPVERTCGSARSIARKGQHDDAVAAPPCADPFVENREIADRQSVGEPLRLAPAENEDHAIAGEIGAREVRIETAILDAVTGVVPRRHGGLQRQRVALVHIEHQQPMSRRLARRDKRQQRGSWPLHCRGSTRRLYLRSEAERTP